MATYNSRVLTCPLDKSHETEQEKLQFHLVKCSKNIYEGTTPYGDENWDQEPPCPSVLDSVQREIEEKPVLKTLEVPSKADKK